MANKLSELTKTLKKNSEGYKYKYTDLAGIHEALAEAKISYWQETITENGFDYIKTHIIDDETGEELRTGRGSKIVEVNEINGKENPAQALGAAMTYARRYSLLAILGLATEDDDAESLTQSKGAANSNRLDFDKIKEDLSILDDLESIAAYSQEVANKYVMTDKQRAAVSKIFNARRKELTNGR